MSLEKLIEVIKKVVEKELEPIKKELAELKKMYEVVYTNLEATKKESKEKIDRVLQRIYDISERLSRVENQTKEKNFTTQRIELPIPDFGEMPKVVAEQKTIEVNSLPTISEESAKKSKVEEITEEPIVIELKKDKDTTAVATEIVRSIQPTTQLSEPPKAQEKTPVTPPAEQKKEEQEPTPVTPDAPDWLRELQRLGTSELYDRFAKLNIKREEIESEISKLNLARVVGEISDAESSRIEELEKELEKITEMIGAIAQLLNQRA